MDIQNKIIFWITRGTFETNKKQPKYWVVPLTNFISTFRWNLQPQFNQHPLRLFSVPTIPETEDKGRKASAVFKALGRSQLICFDFSDKIGFIEPLPDYSDKEEKLKSGKERRLITAIMVGEITEGMDPTWFPHDYTQLLTNHEPGLHSEG